MKKSLSALIWVVALIATASLHAQAPAAIDARVNDSRSNDSRFNDAGADAIRVIQLVDDRLALMPEVAAWKWRAHQPITDLERERQVLDRSVADAEALGLDSAAARRFFAVQIRMARAVQTQSFAKWQSTSAQPPMGRDLNRDLRPALDAIGRELLVAMYLASSDLRNVIQDLTNAKQYAHLRQYGVTSSDIEELQAALLAMRIVKAPSLEVIKQVGVLRVGTTGDYAPFSNDRDGVLQGFDIDLAQDLARYWGVSVRFVRTAWPTLMDDFAKHRFDLAMSGITATPERAVRADFSTAYHLDGKTPIARCEDARKFNSLDQIDQPKMRVIVNPGGTNERFVRERIKRAKIIVHPDNRTVFDELLAGHADVMITDGIEVELQVRRHPELCGTMNVPLTQAPKGIMMPQSTGLAKEVNAWLAPQLANGAVRTQLERASRTAQ